MATSTRRDQREARGYLTDLFESMPNEVRARIVDQLIQHSSRINVQRASDMLVLYFDLNDEETTTEAAETTTTEAA